MQTEARSQKSEVRSKKIKKGSILTSGFWLLASFFLTGCGGRLVPVEGIVTLDGKPLAGATIAFVPQGAGQPASGFTDSEGFFRAGTLAKADGAVPGKYKVTIAKHPFVPRPAGFGGPPGEAKAPEPAEVDAALRRIEEEKRKPPEVPAVYGDLTKTPFTVDIPKGGDRNLEFKLERAASK